MDKKVYVYDTSKGFSSFIKHYYSTKMNIDVCTNKKRFATEGINNYDTCFFVVNDMDDLFKLIKIYYKIEHFFIGSPSKIICEKMETFMSSNVVFLDFNQNKYEMLKTINTNLSVKNII